METEVIDASTGEIVTALVRPDSWSGATTRALEARKEREAIVREILREGHDFGTVPGCGDKPALLKPGAEKIADALNLYPDYEELDKVQDFVNRIWFYRYRCRLRQRGTDIVLSTGIGSCNSEAAKYKFRDAQRTCPHCGKAAIIKGKQEYGGGWLCFGKKGGCGAKFGDNDPAIVDQQTGQVENPDIASLVNTVDKMAQKSSFVAACLNLGFSEQFTQDVDDNPGAYRDEKPKAEPEKTGWTNGITTDQVLRDQLFKQAEKLMSGMTAERRKEALGRLLLLSTDEMGKRINELAENARKKTKQPDEPIQTGHVGVGRQTLIDDIRRDATPDLINKVLTERFGGKTLESLSLDDVKIVHIELVLPF